MKVITRHVNIRTHVQEWTRVSNSTCPVITFIRHKPHPKNNMNLSIEFIRAARYILRSKVINFIEVLIFFLFNFMSIKLNLYIIIFW